MKNKNNGFSLIELMVSLTIGVTLVTTATIFYNKQIEKNTYSKQSEALINYSKNIVNFANANQAIIYNSGRNIKVINSEQLKYFKYISDINKYVARDYKTGSKLYPCTSLLVINGKMQGFTYFRTDDASLSLQKYQSDLKNGKNDRFNKVSDAIRSFGSNGAILYADNNGYILKSSNGSWSLNDSQVNQYFVQQGQDYLQINGLSSSCAGKYIATPSMVISMNNYFSDINSEIKVDNTVQQNNNNITVSNTDNSMTYLNLDSQSARTDLNNNDVNTNATLKSSRNALVFETNKNCEMNPAQLSTMQDYDPNENGINDPNVAKSCTSLTTPSMICSQIKIPNKFGCRNKQLSLTYASGKRCINETVVNGVLTCNATENIDNIVTTGFNQVQSTSVQNSSKLNLGSYLGGLSSNSIQTTAEVSYGETCSIDEIGSIAKQKPNNDTNNFYKKILDANQGILVCQKSPLCSDPTSAATTVNKATIPACWLSTTKTTIEINFTESDRVIAFTAPKGFAIVNKSGFEPVYQQNPMYFSTDPRDFRDGAKTSGKGFSSATNLEGYSGSDGGGGSYFRDIGNGTGCQTHDCGMIFDYPCGLWKTCKACWFRHSAHGSVSTPAAFKQNNINGPDYDYFSSQWLNKEATIENDVILSKGFTGAGNGEVYRDKGDSRLLKSNILQVPNAGSVWNPEQGVFKWAKDCTDPLTVWEPQTCKLNITGLVPTQNCGNGNCMVTNKFSISSGYPRALNAMMTLRVTEFGADKNLNGGTRSQGCNSFRDAIGVSGRGAPSPHGGKIPEVLAYPHYITKIVITNDLSNIPLVENLPPAPPDPVINCSPSNVPTNVKNTLISNAKSLDRNYVDTGTNTFYNIYLNPNTSSYTYTSTQNGSQCDAKLVGDNCYISNANQCKYYLQLNSPTDYSFEVSTNILMQNSVTMDTNGSFKDFSTNSKLYFNVFDQNNRPVESGLFSGIITGEDNLATRNGEPLKVLNLMNGAKLYGQFIMMQVPNSCDKTVACTSPSALKAYTDNGNSISYSP